MTFRRPALSRCVTFAEVAAETRLPEEEVELLVMKALAQNLTDTYRDAGALTAGQPVVVVEMRDGIASVTPVGPKLLEE